MSFTFGPVTTETVTITDTLPGIIESVWEDVVSALRERFIYDGRDCPDLHSDLDHDGSIHELIDSAVPIYTSELNALAYFHNRSAIEALTERFGSADGDWPSGPFAAGLYCLIEQAISERYSQESEDLWEEWTEALDWYASRPETRREALSRWQANHAPTETKEA